MTTLQLGGAVASAHAGTSAQRDEIIARLERLPFSRFHLRLGALLGVGLFFDAFDTVTLAVALTVVFTSLHIGFINAGLLISGTYVGQFVGAWTIGYASELFGRRRAFVFSIGFFGLISVATAFAWNFESLLVFRIIQGIGLGGEIPVASALFNEYMRSARRGRAGSFYQIIFTWGLILTQGAGILFFTLFGKDLGWRLLFLVGGLPALYAIYAWFVLPESARWLADRGRYGEADQILRGIESEPRREPLPPLEIKPQPAVKPTRFTELFTGIYRWRTIAVWIQWFTIYFVAHGQNVWLPTVYVRIGGLPVTRALMLSTISFTVTMVTQYTVACFLDTIGRKPLFLAGFVMIVLGGFYGCTTILVLHSTSWPVLFSAAVPIGIGTAMNSLAIFNYTAELYPTRIRSLGIASGSSMNRLASVISPTAIGILLNAHFGIQSVFAMFGVVGLVGFVVLATMGIETKQRTLEELSP